MERMRDLYNHVLHDQFSLVSAVLPVTAYAAEQRRAIEAMMHSIGSGISENGESRQRTEHASYSHDSNLEGVSGDAEKHRGCGSVFGSRRFRR